MSRNYPRVRRSGLSLLEITAVVALVGILAVVIIPRVSSHGVAAKKSVCFTNKGNIEVQCQLWFRQKSAAPAANLSDIGANKSYFPDGLPKCPVDNSSYSVNQTTLHVNGHSH